MGHLLLSEVQKGTLAHVEFIVRRYEDLLELNMDGPAHPRRHGPQPSWLWSVWPTDAKAGGMKSGRMGRPGVEVLMRMSASLGISLELFCAEENPMAAVYRVLKQYCDDDASEIVWRPIPDPPAKVSKVLDREESSEVRRKRLLGKPVPVSGQVVINRSLKEWEAAETLLVQAISRAQAAQRSATLRELILYCGEVRDAIQAAASVWLKLRSEWTEPITTVLEALLRRCLDKPEENVLKDALEMTNSICSLGIRSPENLETAERARKQNN